MHSNIIVLLLYILLFQQMSKAVLLLLFLASVHFPRIGYNTPNFNWYGTEKLIKKLLTHRNIHTFMYPLILQVVISFI